MTKVYVIKGDQYVMAVGLVEVLAVGEQYVTVKWVGPDGVEHASRVTMSNLLKGRKVKSGQAEGCSDRAGVLEAAHS